jgi:hypothetical protein
MPPGGFGRALPAGAEIRDLDLGFMVITLKKLFV